MIIIKLPYKDLDSLGSERLKHSIRRTKLRDKKRHFLRSLVQQLSVVEGINTILQNLMGFETKIYRDKKWLVFYTTQRIHLKIS
jgi:hypothetical protein